MLAGFAAIAILARGAQATYHPTTGRFLERDPDGYVDGQNQYEYVRSNPETKTDPSGTQSVPAAGVVTAAEVGAAQATLAAARASGNPATVQAACSRLQIAIELLNQFVSVVAKGPDKYNLNVDGLRATSSQAGVQLERARGALSYFREALKVAEQKFPAGSREAYELAIKNLGDRIAGAQKVIQEHLVRIANSPTSLDVPGWQHTVRVQQENIARAQEATKWVKSAVEGASKRKGG
jgi:uncharacterized protein RhaS with RHS repeats